MPFLARNVARLQCWLTNLPRFQGARPDHVRVESSRSRCCCPRTLEKLPELQLTNQNKRRYHFRFYSVNQLFAILTSVAPNWQRHCAKESCLKQRQNTADPLGVWAK